MSEVGVTGVSLNDLYLTKQQTNKNWKTEAVMYERESVK